ncbi:MAG: glutathione S-transferase N-terminal domain-containing protein [Acidiferrobacterales bacterium]|nr:glutathione S-transferase N-terminal domain-containing protein [Acidiferrobacterales bacterium]
MTAQVEIYGTSFCRHCMAARALLDSKQIDYTEYLIDLMPLERAEMLRRCGRKKVPQILINNTAIGGDEELMTLDASGELDRLLNFPG